MYSHETIVEKNITLSFEFERYLMEHPEMLDNIPTGEEVVLLPKDDPALYRFNLESAQNNQHTSGDSVVFVEIEALKPHLSRLVNPQMTLEPILEGHE
jgi:hypothetical protein